MAFAIDTVPSSPGFPQTVIPGVPVTVPQGATLQLIDTDTGQVVDPATLSAEVQPDGSLVITLEDGTQIVLVGASPEAVEPAAGEPSPEAELEPAAGPTGPGGGGVDAGGSSEAVAVYFEDGFGNIFGIGPRGPFVPFGPPGLEIPDPEPVLLEELAPPIINESVPPGENLLFTDAPELGIDTPTNDQAFFNNPDADIFNEDGSYNFAFDDISGSSGIPFDGNITHARNGNDEVELADKDDSDGGNPNNNLGNLFGEPTAFYGGTGNDTVTGGNDDDIIVGDGRQIGLSKSELFKKQKMMDDPFGGEEPDLEGAPGKFGGPGRYGHVAKVTGYDDSLFGGEGKDVLIGDGILGEPGFGPESDIAFPNYVDPPVGGTPDVDLGEADLLRNYILGMFGLKGTADVLDIEVERQLRVHFQGGDDTLVGGDDNDFAVGDSLIVVEGYPTPYDYNEGWIGNKDVGPEGSGGGGGWGGGGRHRGYDIKLYGGDDTIEGNEGDDALVGDGLARLPSALFGSKDGGGLGGFLGGGHGGGILYLADGGESCNCKDDPFLELAFSLSTATSKLVGGNDTILGNSGDDLMIGDGILAAYATGGRKGKKHGGDECNAADVAPDTEGVKNGGDYYKARNVALGGDDTMVGGSGSDIMAGDGIVNVEFDLRDIRDALEGGKDDDDDDDCDDEWIDNPDTTGPGGPGAPGGDGKGHLDLFIKGGDDLMYGDDVPDDLMHGGGNDGVPKGSPEPGVAGDEEGYADLMIGDGIVNITIGAKSEREYRCNPCEICEDDVRTEGEGGGKGKGKFDTILAGGDDEMYGGMAGDTMIGDGIAQGGYEYFIEKIYSCPPCIVADVDGAGDHKDGKHRPDTLIKGGDDLMFGGDDDDSMVGDGLLSFNLGKSGGLLKGGYGYGLDLFTDSEFLFSDLDRGRGKGKFFCGPNTDNVVDDEREIAEAKMVGGDDWMFGGDGDDLMRGDGMWRLEMFYGPYGPEVELVPVKHAKGGDDVMFGGTGNDSMWGEGGHDFMVGDGLATGFDVEGLDDVDIFELIGDLLGGIGTGGADDDDILDAVEEAIEILSGIELIEGGVLKGGNDLLVGGDDDDRHHHGHGGGSPCEGGPISCGAVAVADDDPDDDDDDHSYKGDDEPFWNEFFGLDDIILGDGLIGATGKILDEEGEEIVGESTFRGQGGNDTLIGNSGDDVLAGDAIVYAHLGVLNLPEDPGTSPLADDEFFFKVSLRGGDDIMFGDDRTRIPRDGDGRGRGKDGGRCDPMTRSEDDSVSTEGGNGHGGKGYSSYDDYMFGDLLVGVDGSGVLGKLLRTEESDASQQLFVDMSGGNDTMVGGEGSDVMHGDAILWVSGVELSEFIGDIINPLDILGAVADLGTAAVGGGADANVFLRGGDDLIWGDNPGRGGRGGPGGPGGPGGKSISDGVDDVGLEGGGKKKVEIDYDDLIVGDGIIAIGGSQRVIGGDDTAFGGRGDDIMLGDGVVVTDPSAAITAGNDKMFGGSGHDILYGDALYTYTVGDELVNPLSGESWLDQDGRIRFEEGIAKGGNDMLDGGEGNDVVFGEIGDDMVDGGEGLDVVFGGTGSDIGIWDDPYTMKGDPFGDVVNTDTGTTVGEKDFYSGNFGAYNADTGDIQITTEPGADDPDGEGPLEGEDYDVLRMGLTEDQLTSPDILAELLEYQALLDTPGGDATIFEFDFLPLVVVEWEDVDFFLHGCPDLVLDRIIALGSFIVDGEELGENVTSFSGSVADDEMIVGTDNDDFISGDDEVGFGIFFSNDLIIGQGGNDFLIGDSNDGLDSNQHGGDDKLFGGSGNDLLIGDTGAQPDHNINSGATGGDDELHGGSGNDTLIGDGGENLDGGTGGNDKLDGGEEVDHLFGDVYADILKGGQGGDDKMFGGGSTDTMFGDAGRSILNDSFGGDDKMFGGDADDLMAGDAGRDLAYGGHGGDDKMFGGDGSDSMSGDAGNDIQNASYGGNDTMVGGDQGDWMTGDAGNSILSKSEGGDDYMDGGMSADTLFGDAANRLVDSAGGDDTMIGGDDSDTLFGDSGNDMTAGSSGGDDLIVGDLYDDFNVSASINDLEDFFDTVGIPKSASVGKDTLFGDTGGSMFGDPVTTIVSTDIATDLNNFEGYVVGGDDHMVGDSLLQINLDLFDERFFFGVAGAGGGGGGRGKSPLPADAGGDTIYGDAGQDMYSALGGNDRIFGDHEVTVNLEQGPIFFDDGPGAGVEGGYGRGKGLNLEDLASAVTSSSDTIFGDAGNDMNFSYGGNDFVVADTSIEILGDFDFDPFDPRDVRAGSGLLKGINLDKLSAEDRIYGDAGGNLFWSTGGDDTIYGDNYLSLGALEDFILDEILDNLPFGADLLFRYCDIDIMNLVGDDDTIYGDAGNDLIDSVGGNDTLYGQGGDDFIYGDAGDRLIRSVGGDDDIFGGHGNDTLVGDAGNEGGLDDVFPPSEVLTSQGGNDYIEGGHGDDLIVGDALGDLGAPSGSTTAIGGDDELYGGDGNDQIYGDVGSPWGKTEGSVTADIESGSQGGDDLLDGGAGNDLLVGDAEDRFRQGHGGDDSLFGGDDDDVLYGDQGRSGNTGGLQFLRDPENTEGVNSSATGGDDTLDGGSGNDTAFGGMGNDLGIWYGDNDFDWYDGGGSYTGSPAAPAEETENGFLEGADQDGAIDTLRMQLSAKQLGSDETMQEIADFLAHIQASGTDVGDDSYFTFSELDGDDSDIDLIAVEWEALQLAVHECPDLVFDVILDDGVLKARLAGSGDGFTTASDVFAAQGDNTYIGSEGDDLFFGLGGEDTLIGDPGDASTGGDMGDDVLSGGDGNDVILGDRRDGLFDEEGGDDKLTGGDGNDLIIGDTGRPMDNGSGNDMTGDCKAGDITGSSGRGGDDIIDGGPGDSIFGDQNWLYGDAYTDIKEGASGGDDTVRGGLGDDSIWGDAGRNLGAVPEEDDEGGSPMLVAPVANNGYAGYGGHDWLSGAGSVDTVFGDAGNDILNESHGGDDVIFGDMGHGSESIYTENWGDKLYGDAGRNIEGAPLMDEDDIGNDGAPSTDTTEIEGASFGGRDTIAGEFGDDSIFGDAGNDIIRSVSGDDVIAGDHLMELDDDCGVPRYIVLSKAGDDTIHGDAGNDLVDSEGGDDLIAGDNLTIGGGRGIGTALEPQFYGDDSITGDAGQDMYGSYGGHDVIFGDDADIINVRLPRQMIIDGGGNDWIAGDAGEIIADGSQGGDDQIYGQGGNDWISGDAGYSIIGEDTPDEEGDDAAGGDDTISGGSGNDQIYGDAGGFLRDGARGGHDIVAGDVLFTGIALALTTADVGTAAPAVYDDRIFGDAHIIEDAVAGDDILVGDNLEFYGDGVFGDEEPRSGEAFIGIPGHDLIAGDAGKSIGDGGTGGDDVIFGDSTELFLFEGAPPIGKPVGDPGVGTTECSPCEVCEIDEPGGDDTLFGDAVESIFAGSSGGDDLIFGQGGDDTVVGDAGEIIGKVVFDGEELEDIIAARGGHDELYGGSGNDLMSGDALYRLEAAVAGNDTVFGDHGDDVMFGDVGYAFTFNSFSGQILDSVAGDDWLFGGCGNDVAVGDVGGHVKVSLLGKEFGFRSVLGDDDIWGGDGEDTLIGDAAGNIDGHFGGDDYLDGGKDDDLLIGDSARDIRVLFGGGEALDAAGGDDTLVGGDGYDTLIGDGGELIGGAKGGDDELHGDADDDTLIGDVAEDIVDGSSGGDDTLSGGSGNDGIAGDSGDDIVGSTGGNDIILGGSGNDMMSGDAAETLTEGSLGGDDEIFGGKGDDEAAGDAFYIEAGSAGGSDWIWGEHGNDELSGDAVDEISDATGGNDGLFGGKGDDILAGDAFNDLYDSTGGDDFLDGGSGNDGLTGDGGGDLAGGSLGGDDTLLGGDGYDTLVGDAGENIGGSTGGNDTLEGGDDRDQLFGDSFLDLRMGATGGDDELDGGSGNDDLIGDAGGEIFGESSGGNDTLTGDTGNDDMAGDSRNSIYDGSSGGDDTLFGGVGNDDMVGDTWADILNDSMGGNDTLEGGDNDDYIVGDAADGIAFGSSGGDDLIDGGSGNDILVGDADNFIDETSSAGDDTLLGGEGDDLLVGDTDGTNEGEGGDDTLTGGGGNDTFRVTAENNGDDLITDFEVGDDILNIVDLIDNVAPGGIGLEDLDDAATITDNGADVTIDFGGGNSVTINGVGDGSVDTAAELETALGGAANLILDG